MTDTFKEMYEVIENRRANPQEGSYTCYLFDKGIDKILKKCGVVETYGDCDDTLLVKVIQTGAACHTGNRTCFFNRIK